MSESHTSRVHIVTCFDTICDEVYRRMCDDLEAKGVGCVVEGRGDYGLGSIPFKEKFKEVVDSTSYTVIHLCPKMIEKLEQVKHVLETRKFWTKCLYIQTKDTPTDLPTIYKEASRITMYNDTQYKNIVKRLTETVLLSARTESPAAKVPSDKTDGNAGNGHEEVPEISTSSNEVFLKCVDSSADRDGGVYYLSSKIRYTPHPLLKYSCQSDIRDMSQRGELYTPDTRTNTVRWLLTRVLPEVSRRSDTGSMIELMNVPVPQIRDRAVTMYSGVLLSSRPHDVTVEHLKSAEKNLLDIALNFRQSKTAADGGIVCIYFVTLLHRLVVSHQENTPMSNSISRILQRLLLAGADDPVLADIKTFVEFMKTNRIDLTREVMRPGSKESPIKRPWPLQFAVVLGTLSNVNHGDYQTKLKALEALPKLLKPGRSGQFRRNRSASKTNILVGKLVTLGMVSFLHSLGEVTGEDIHERAVLAFKVLRSSLDTHSDPYRTLGSLLFTQSDLISGEAHSLLKLTLSYAETLSFIMVSEAMKKLQPISIDLTQSIMGSIAPPGSSWTVLPVGRLSDRVMLHVNLPQDSDLRGVMGRTTTHSDHGYLNTVDILRTLSPHSNILSLWAYRTDRIPVFFVTEDYSQPDLHRVLYYKLRHKSWMMPLELLHLLLQALDAVIYLQQNGIVHRDLTASSFTYNKEQNSVKLCRFDLARKCDRDQTIVDRDCDGIPTRWSAPESLSKCHFSFRSDCWMLGHLIYEIITHGSLPYSDLTQKTEADIAELIKKGTKKLCHERCIPTKVFATIVECTEFTEDHRLSACEAKCKLEETLEDYSGPELKDRLCPVNPESVFPQLDRMSRDGPHRGLAGDYAIRGVFPRTTSTFSVNQMEADRDEMDLHPNTVSLLELPGVFRVEESETKLEVKEHLKRPFSASEESLLLTQNVAGIQDHVTVVKYEDGEALSYSIPVSCQGNLRRVFEDSMFGEDPLRYIDCLRVVAKTLAQLHARNWVHGCLSADNIWVVKADLESGNYQIYLSQLAYMRQSRDIGDGIVADDVTDAPKEDDVFRRSAPEVIQNGIYSSASDVYSYGLILWDALSALGLYKNELSQNQLDRVEKEKLYEYLTTKPGNEILPKPKQCPDEVYSLMVTCWSPERHGRPRMDTVQQKLLQYIISKTQPPESTHTYQSLDGDAEEDELYDSIEETSPSTVFHDGPSTTNTDESHLSDWDMRLRARSEGSSTLVGHPLSSSHDHTSTHVNNDDIIMRKNPLPTPPKPHLQNLTELGNEQEGKVVHMSHFLKNAQAVTTNESAPVQPGRTNKCMSLSPGTFAQQLPNVGHPSANILPSNPFEASYRHSVRSEDTTSDLYKHDAVSSVGDKRRSVGRKTPPIPLPKPKVSTRNTGVTATGNSAAMMQNQTQNLDATKPREIPSTISKGIGFQATGGPRSTPDVHGKTSEKSLPVSSQNHESHRALLPRPAVTADPSHSEETPTSAATATAARQPPPVPHRPPPQRRPSNSGQVSKM